ncbi:hypothetical protein D3C72_1432290 [compost metagenome]
MRQRLRRVAHVPPMAVELFGIQPQRVGVPEQLFELQVGLVELAGAGQAFDVPERAGGEGAFAAGQAVDLAVVVAVAVDHAVAHQALFDGLQGRQPARVAGADETHQRHQQHRTVQAGAADVLDEMSAFLAPEVLPDVGVDRLAGLVPARERCR